MHGLCVEEEEGFGCLGFYGEGGRGFLAVEMDDDDR